MFPRARLHFPTFTRRGRGHGLQQHLQPGDWLKRNEEQGGGQGGAHTHTHLNYFKGRYQLKSSLPAPGEEVKGDRTPFHYFVIKNTPNKVQVIDISISYYINYVLIKK